MLIYIYDKSSYVSMLSCLFSIGSMLAIESKGCDNISLPARNSNPA